MIQRITVESILPESLQDLLFTVKKEAR